MYWQKFRLFICILHLVLLGVHSEAQFDDQREAFYRRQVMKDLKRQNRLPEVSEPKAYTEIEEEKEFQTIEDNEESEVETAKVRFNRPQNIVGSAAQRETYKLENSPEQERNWGLGLELASGYSSNIARFEGAPSGTFFDISPNAYWAGRLGPRMEFAVTGDVFYRTFSDKAIDELFRTLITNISGEMTYFLSETFFFGLSGKTTQFDGREIDFTTPTNDGRDSQLSINSFQVELGREWEKSFIELSAGQEYLRGKTTILDEAGNQFFPDINQSMTGLRVGRQFLENFRWEAGYQFKYRDYLDTRARLENGAVDPNFDTADLLTEVEHSVLTSLFIYDFLVEGGYDYTLDLQAGGMNRQSFHGTVILPIEMWGSLLFKPEAGLRRTDYQKFVGQIFRNPGALAVREDLWYFYGAEVIVDLGMIDPVLSVRRTSLDSNFTIINFNEDFASIGIQGAF